MYKFDAKDKDSGQNSRLQFYIRGRDSSFFSLDTSTGLLTAKTDLESGRSYSLDLEVLDNGQPMMSSKESVTVIVSDSTIFPQFASAVDQISIKEGQIDQ